MIRVPKWAYPISVLLVVMSSILGVAVVFIAFVLLGILPQGTDIQMPLLLVILPLSIIIVLTTIMLAILLTRKRD